MKQVTLLLFIVLVALFGCSNNEAETEIAGKSKDEGAALKDKKETEAPMTQEELAANYFEVINTDDVQAIYDSAYEGQTESLKVGIEQMQNELDATQLEIKLEKVIDKIEIEDYTLLLLITKVVDQEGNILNYSTGQMPFMKVDGEYQYAWDFSLLPDRISQQRDVVNQKLNQLLESDGEVKQTLQWLDEQNQMHQEAFNMHLQAHQQAIDQNNQMMQQQQLQQQMQQQQMMTPPPAPVGF
ncbi:hypothetical protein GH741_00250 [Aquibacillus halophilus]|uniref:DUF5105 domain-containing protein n=1 Tax=Aquibacillus halophilus TaxID=930132 RepID=A0A6A8DIG5_9BACI|nr:hypothetical protein [Aquibacillus halophilus]MRH41102.1 hypothetical protein [Aquibacillus halophilus]